MTVSLGAHLDDPRHHTPSAWIRVVVVETGEQLGCANHPLICGRVWTCPFFVVLMFGSPSCGRSSSFSCWSLSASKAKKQQKFRAAYSSMPHSRTTATTTAKTACAIPKNRALSPRVYYIVQSNSAIFHGSLRKRKQEIVTPDTQTPAKRDG